MSKLVSLNIISGVRLPHTIEGVDVVAADMLVDLTTKHRLMALRPGLFHKNDPDWPVKVVEVVVIEAGMAEEVPAEKPAKKAKKSNDGDNPT